MADRKPLVLGNWKMNELEIDLSDHGSGGMVVEESLTADAMDHEGLWVSEWAKLPAVDVTAGVAPSFTGIFETIQTVKNWRKQSGDDATFLVGAQTAISAEYGAYTGDVSPVMLAKMGCSFVILGHSEQRRYHPEDDDKIALKAKAALRAGLTPVICIGETALGRSEGIGVDYALSQLADAMSLLDCTEAAKIVIAYEPVWAIGTGHAPAPAVVESALADIRDCVNAGYGADVAAETRILYGGSVNAGNAAELAALHDVDGFLVGGASLSPMEFHKICEQAESADKKPRITGGPSAVEPGPSEYIGTELTLARESAKRPGTISWRLQLALAAYRVMGFQWLETQAMLTAGYECLPENYPDLLRDEIWRRRTSVVARLLAAIRLGKIRGVSSAGEWLVATDGSLTGDSKCYALARERATAAAALAYKALASKPVDQETFREIYEAGYLAADADTRNRHWMRRGVDKKPQELSGSRVG